MKTRDFVAMGIPAGRCAESAQRILQAARTGKKKAATAVLDDLRRVAASPDTFVNDASYGELARLLIDSTSSQSRFVARATAAPSRIWGDDIDPAALQQLQNACALPVSVAAAPARRDDSRRGRSMLPIESGATTSTRRPCSS